MKITKLIGVPQGPAMGPILLSNNNTLKPNVILCIPTTRKDHAEIAFS